MTACISDELFHFVGRANPNDHEANFKMLCRVLEGRTISHPPHDGTWGQTSITVDPSGFIHAERLIVPTVTCYCDIPREALSIHTRKYGEFGLSLSCHYLIQYGARPVTYIPMRPDDYAGAHSGTRVLSTLQATYLGLRNQLLSAAGERPGSSAPTRQPDSPETAMSHLKRTLEVDVLAFIKPYDSTLNDHADDYYYAEREWRKHGNMKFEPVDVITVVVPPDFVERAKEALPAYATKVWARPV
jgi:hypothetical protein